MALSLPKAKTLLVSGIDPNGVKTGDKFELTTSVGRLAPALTIPTTFDLARNTSHQGTGSMLQNVRFMGAVKPVGEIALVAADGSLAQDPRLLKATEAEVLVAQLTPQAKIKKVQVLNWDQNVEGNEQVLAQYVASWVQVRRVRKELELFNLTVAAAKAAQVKVAAEDAKATTFAAGSHTQEFDLAGSTPIQTWDLFNEATINFGKIGLTSAKLDINKGFAHTEGIGDTDILVYISKEFKQKLFQVPSLLASAPGNEMFRSAGLTLVNGIYVATTNNLPEGIHMMVVSTGMSGTFAHEQVGDGIGGNILIDPNWSKAKRLDLWDEYVLGVVYGFLAFVAEQPAPASK